ncbi:MAG TPA: DUF4389 domain-containing protein [Rhizomicrobium sp.]|jgi:hypothetical protein|nr:DUF4389 domain-containing protein [Rhizomicrobium sp.]
MTDVPPGGAQALPTPVHRPFPLARLLYSIGFAVLAWVVLWAAIIVGVVQFVVFAINGRANEELTAFSGRLVKYLWELLGYVTFFRQEMPFPFGPFPKA